MYINNVIFLPRLTKDRGLGVGSVVLSQWAPGVAVGARDTFPLSTPSGVFVYLFIFIFLLLAFQPLF